MIGALVIAKLNAGPIVPTADATGIALRVDSHAANATPITMSSESVAYADNGVAEPVHDEFGDVAAPVTADPVEARAAGTDAPGQDHPVAVEATAPSSSEDKSTTASNVDIADTAQAGTVAQDAHANWNGSACQMSSDPLADAAGHAVSASVDAPNAAPNAPPLVAVRPVGAERPELSSHSTTTVVTHGSHTGLRTETHQRFSPMVFNLGPSELVVQPLGEWVLAVEADGTDGGAHASYYIDGAGPSSPALRITSGTRQVVLSVEQVFSGGLSGDVPVGPGASAVIGRPHVPSDNGDSDSPPLLSDDGTQAAAAVDVVRMTLDDPNGGDPVDVRIGHMEANVHVPVGGLVCGAN